MDGGVGHERGGGTDGEGEAVGAGLALAPLDPRVRTAWWLEAAAMAAIVTALAGAGAAAIGFAAAPIALLAVGAPTALLAAVVPVVRYRRWRYALREDDLWLRRGVLWTKVSVIPFSRLQFVDTRQGPLERVLGLARLVVHTAALGTSGVLPGLDADEAAGLRDRLSAHQRDAGV